MGHCFRFTLAATLLSSHAIGAQQVAAYKEPRVLLGQRVALSVEAGRIGSLQAAGDSSLLMLDAADRSLWLVPLHGRQAVPFARVGSGPAEVRIPVSVLRWEHETNLITDLGNQRWLHVRKDLTVLPPIAFGRIGQYLIGGTIWGTDTLGHMYVSPRAILSLAPERTSIRGPVLRVSLTDARIDTVAWVNSVAGEEVATRTVGPGLVQSLSNRPLASQDFVIVAPDGQVAVLRGDTGFVDFFDNAKLTRSTRLPVARIPVTKQEQQEYFRSRVVAGTIAVIQSPGSKPRRNAQLRPSESSIQQELAGTKWPDFLPTFVRGALFDSSRRLWIPRVQRTGSSDPVYDVIDANGKYLEAFRLPKGTRVTLFLKRYALLTYTDEDGFDRLDLVRTPE